MRETASPTPEGLPVAHYSPIQTVVLMPGPTLTDVLTALRFDLASAAKLLSTETADRINQEDLNEMLAEIEEVATMIRRLNGGRAVEDVRARP